MTTRKTLALAALPPSLAALIALAAAGCDRFRPSAGDAPSKDAGKPAPTLAAVSVPPAAPRPAPAAQAAQAAPPAAAPAPAPAPRERMSGAQEADFDAWIVKTYLACWRQPAQPAESDPYVARVRIQFKPDGSLAKTPKLVNPPSDPALKPQARSVMQAVKACDPLPVPAQYRPFYEQWKTQTIQFNPQIASR